ncbi:Signal peptidase I [Zhongshania aliphaticivorans]|uniref:Signal peptidase I n=1 Tax=Zhongshania aliphaticivorans TaxID=1470434 RepID=A0A5S9MRR9_9GAMM|nr:signal peptidase I [Zhongshania aliphaticivorans]CAA0079485.1 Signal peptidase I [Zhongshania aliphaticivorans]CAA0086175.1 Signal peptidase I [Zhongshania aliphaticivorans]
MRNWIFKNWKENRSFFLFITLMFVFRSAFADWNTVPTGSMKPTILEGDRILVNKIAYDLRVPFTHISLYKVSDPVRGDIIVFDSKVSGKKLVKRIVGIPGDIVELNNNVLRINGEPLAYKDIGSSQLTTDRVENLFGIKHSIRVKKNGSRLSSFKSVAVPAEYYLALGDNRDNSADSRVIGFVPRNEIVGRSKSVVMSFNYENFYIPRKDRFFHTL